MIGMLPILYDHAEIKPWLFLLARLDATLHASESPESMRIFRILGPRRYKNARRRLLLERKKLTVEIERIGICPVEEWPMHYPAISNPIAVDSNYEYLADAFANCAPIALKMGNMALYQWMIERARMHLQQARFLST